MNYEGGPHGYLPTTPIRHCSVICRKIGTKHHRWGIIRGGVFHPDDREPWKYEEGLEWKVLFYREKGRLNDLIRDQTGTFDTKKLSKLYDPEHDAMWQRNWITQELANAAKAKMMVRRIERGVYCNITESIHPLQTIKTHKAGEKVVALLLVQHWMLGRIAPIYNNHIVVATWTEYSSGTPAVPAVVCEGKTTIGILAKQEDAEILFEAYVEKHNAETHEN